jgi:energy-coupling factor transporter transmembrane protein EcfT
VRSVLTRAPRPAALLTGALAFLVCLIFASRPAEIIYMIILWIIIAVGLRLQLGAIFNEIKKMWPFLGLTFLLHLILSGHNTVDLEFFSRFDVKQLGWVPASLFTLRLALILSIGIALFQLHPPQRYGREVGRTLGKLRLGRSSWAQSELVVTLALRLIPFLEAEQQRLRMALAARGVETGSSRLDYLRNQRKLLFPLILNAFRRADHVSLALEARGWDPNITRTSLHSDSLARRDALLTALFVVACIGSRAL